MDRKLFCFWFGPLMSDSRRACFKSMVANSGVQIVLVTEKNLAEYIKAEYPLHRCFNLLSLNHKSDYLRAYFMRHYGGGYADVKQCDFDWNPYFDKLEASDRDFIGCPEWHPDDIGYVPAKPLFNKLIGASQYIFKPNSAFAIKWMQEVNSLMDNISDRITQYPGNILLPRPEYQTPDSEYPLYWTELGGTIIHRLLLDHLDDFIIGMPRVNIGNYR